MNWKDTMLFVFLGCKTEGKHSQIISDDMCFSFYFFIFYEKRSGGRGDDGLDMRDKRQE
jgi:hypothetical protein